VLHGLAFQDMVAEQLAKGGTYGLAKLTEHPTSKFPAHKFPPLHIKKVKRNDLTDLTELEPNTLVIPETSNFPSVDMFAILPASYLDATRSATTMVCVGFQVTVRTDHGVKNAGLRHVLARCNAVKTPTVRKIDGFKLVFVTATTGIAKTQSIVPNESQKGTNTQRPLPCEQFAIRLSDAFEELGKMHKEMLEAEADKATPKDIDASATAASSTTTAATSARKRQRRTVNPKSKRGKSDDNDDEEEEE
jgi:hypothetical protein